MQCPQRGPIVESALELRQELIQALKELNEVSDRVHQALNASAVPCAMARELAESGRQMTELIDVIDPMPLRSAMSECVDGLERARRRTERTMFRMLRAEGATNADIARGWGISRALVSRRVNEH